MTWLFSISLLGVCAFFSGEAVNWDRVDFNVALEGIVPGTYVLIRH